ncbi:MAG TPA: MBL fold metallo-hydrolase [Devosiaceae bacterium]|jgi:glyoxylase-like metal-dependent hydrolase (beta-lactamase superfamily II)|nr:MBL fold metallo-hydrolase [Devosiaceae bacterium]
MAASPPLPDAAFDPQTGRPVEVAPNLVRVTAGNSGPYTHAGTNSYIVGGRTVLVVDPGPDDAKHMRALLAAIDGRAVAGILLTHTHRDHSALAPRLQEATGAPVLSGGRHRLSRPQRPLEINPVGAHSDWRLMPDRVLADGEEVRAGETVLAAIATPGHCANHFCFGLSGTQWLLSGDHVMGWNSTLVAVPDGSMADYLDSLRRLPALPYQRYLPGHGGSIADGPARAVALLDHRQLRNRQVLEAVASGATRIGQLVRRIYPDLAPPLRPAARMTLAAHVEYLEAKGELRVERSLLGRRLTVPRT